MMTVGRAVLFFEQKAGQGLCFGLTVVVEVVNDALCAGDWPAGEFAGEVTAVKVPRVNRPLHRLEKVELIHWVRQVLQMATVIGPFGPAVSVCAVRVLQRSHFRGWRKRSA